MRPNLEALRTEMLDHLASRNLVVFHSHPRADELGAHIYWDTEHYADYRQFVAAAEAAGVRLITVFARVFSDELIENCTELLDGADFGRDERRSLEARLRELSAYVGFTCEIEMAFDLNGQTYVFDLRTDWFDEANELQDSLEAAYSPEEDEEQKGPLGGYYSNN